MTASARLILFYCYFFFSSRRRHTRSLRDWSSDVCSSDLELSGGMRKRAAIARAMALEPDLLFLDEPSAGLDPVAAVELDDLILQLNSQLGLTFVVVTHDLESVFKIGKTCVMLDRESRTIIARGDPRVL